MISKAAVWFSRFVWLGILFDLIVGIPAIFAPAWALHHIPRGGEPTGSSLTWVAFSSLLSVLVSSFLLPVAMEPIRFPAISRMAVGSRYLQALFLFVAGGGLFDFRAWVHLVLAIVQTPLLVVALRKRPRPDPWEDREENDVSVNDFYEYRGTSFNELERIVMSNPLTTLPQYVTLGPSDLLQLFNAAARNLADRRDIRPYFNKLIHAHGICATGVWEIDVESDYTGYFKRGSRGLLVARLSVAGNALKRGQRRSFGIAGKIFPGMDRDAVAKPANFVTVSHLSGNYAKNIVDIVPTNAPSIGIDPAANFINRVVFRLMDTRPGLRQLHPISTLGVPPGDRVVTPDLMILTIAPGTPRVAAEDFRDELRLNNYPDRKLVYDIKVKNFADERWTRLGSITLTEAAVTEAGDKRLHFWIPSDLPSRN